MIIHSKFKDYLVDLVDDFSLFDELVKTDYSQFVIDSNVYRSCYPHPSSLIHLPYHALMEYLKK